jgi:DNA-binding NarL/FixJ family response regulator
VLEVSTGEAALALIEDALPQIILMDITLPGINGLEATRRIKSTHPSTKIVMLTVHDDSIYRAHATAAGASAYVSKQAIRSDLGATLATLLANYHVVGFKDPIH